MCTDESLSRPLGGGQDTSPLLLQKTGFYFVFKQVRIQACGDVMIMIGPHARSVHELIPHTLWGKGDVHFLSSSVITKS